MNPDHRNVAEDLRVAVFWAHVAGEQLNRLYRELEHLVQDREATYSGWWLATAEYHYTMLSLAHVVKACGRAPELPQFRDSHLITLLHNFHEHWDDQEGPSARSLRDVRPNHVTESARLLDGNLWMHGIRSEDLHAWLSAVDDAARAALTAPWDEMPAPSDPLPA